VKTMFAGRDAEERDALQEIGRTRWSWKSQDARGGGDKDWGCRGGVCSSRSAVSRAGNGQWLVQEQQSGGESAVKGQRKLSQRKEGAVRRGRNGWVKSECVDGDLSSNGVRIGSCKCVRKRSSNRQIRHLRQLPSSVNIGWTGKRASARETEAVRVPLL
jgi:hypothetical protein